MAFWGVEVLPFKPYALSFGKSRGRLRITQATLGVGLFSNRCTMRCNVGNKRPVLLCTLLPCVSETCHLELEFEEDEEVIFSVLGPISIHLTGYFLGHVHSLDGDDTESYGEDITESDTSDSYSYVSEDEYESYFIDDADVAIYADSPVHKSSVEEIEGHAKESLSGAKDTDNDGVNTPVTCGDPDTCKKSKKKPEKKRVGEEGMSDEKDTCKEDKIDADKVTKVDETSVDKISEADANPAAADVNVTKKKKKKNKKQNNDSDTKHEASVKGKSYRIRHWFYL